MTLFRQIALVVTTGVLVLLMLISSDNFRRTSNFLESQMQVSAQDVATTLGIAITSTGTGNDIPALETFFNAMFDSGYYSQIRLVGLDGNVVHEKVRSLSIENIPDWFVELVPLSPATGKAQIRQGWVNFGTLEVTLHPGLAYAELYSNVKNSLPWFALLFVVILAVLWFDLHVMLRPLKKIKEQADAIHENRFVRQDTMPKTIELRRVVEAMNHMIDKVQQIFKEQEESLSRYQRELFTDDLTGLPNRKYVLPELRRCLSEESTFDGSLLIFKMQALEELREKKGYAQADAAIKTLARVLAEGGGVQADQIIGRMGDDEFAVIAPLNEEQALASANRVFELFHAEFGGDADATQLVAGSVPVRSGLNVGAVLADGDMALTQALTAGAGEYRRASSTHLSLPQGKMQWREWFRDKLENDGFYLVGQAVYDLNKQVMQREVFIRVDDESGEVIPAGVFMPMAQVLGYDLAIDRTVFGLLTKLSVGQTEQPEYAINLSLSFFQRADALGEFEVLLSHLQDSELKLSVEASHNVLLSYPDMCAQIAATVKAAGHRFGIDHLDLNRSLAPLQSMQPNYVKINARILEELSQSTSSGAYQALRTLTATMDIQLYAVGVDATELAEHLKAIGVDGMQGHLLGKPEVLA